MKALIVAALLLCSGGISNAEKLLWTWKPAPSATPPSRAVHVVSSDLAGNTAIVIGELSPENVGQYRLVWIGFRGNVIYETTFPTDDAFYTVLLGRQRPVPWAIGAVSATSLTVYDGKELLVLSLKGRAVSVVRPDLTAGQAESVDVIFPNGPLAFKGWIKRRSLYVGIVIVPDPFAPVSNLNTLLNTFDLKELSAWVP